ncbi:high-affinity potassium transporter [Nannizzia gypsea CBS 118893]|uniref:High-affinity potassium transporter n=1 Tax=Arthroderma gypseum (strain ATCC MYA-4604 / CBS 118893) TaxID=535722 RepID=E4V781_ARTGP|nr:high-affinity potassium transporter [Nannizzia gypsea CBS 118893]EFQ96947.1 high-affinity potassium transporter [Nannizzia gypsea CBS 118893]
MVNLEAVLRWPHINFVTLHYAYIIFMSVLSLAILYPAGNMAAIDAYFFGASSATESGLNTMDLKELYTYQQLYVYFIPMFTNLGFINSVVVLVRFLWFRKHLSKLAPQLRDNKKSTSSKSNDVDAEAGHIPGTVDNDAETKSPGEQKAEEKKDEDDAATAEFLKSRTINFEPSADNHPKNDETLYIPGPRDRDRGITNAVYQSPFEISVAESSAAGGLRRRFVDGLPLAESNTIGRVANIASSAFVLGPDHRHRRGSISSNVSQQREVQARNSLALSQHASLGRNSDFYNLTREDREKLGGIEYRSLKLLLKIVFTYYFGLHLFGAICLVGWIQYADPKYRAVLAASSQNIHWWAFYSAQTMVDNLGFTLTPDSMISFRDAQWPMFIMSLLAFAGNTLYPVFLRLVIWTISKLAPKNSSIQEPLSFLLDHPRRCYTLLFPSRPTWILFGIIFAMNFIDTLLILVLDLKNPEVASIPLGPRILAAIFQAASARHTGTAAFNLANVNPAVQFSLLVMMYIAIFPIAISMRSSNTYEDKSLGIYERPNRLDESSGTDYLLKHMRNQLSFDLWFIFLGAFCICIAESERIADTSIPAFSVWTVFFEVTSAYGNVGLSLGYPDVSYSLSGKFSLFSKLVVCVIMIRGRHRGLPYALDRAIILPNGDGDIDVVETDDIYS